jgi:hypothetical protein
MPADIKCISVTTCSVQSNIVLFMCSSTGIWTVLIMIVFEVSNAISVFIVCNAYVVLCDVVNGTVQYANNHMLLLTISYMSTLVVHTVTGRY